MLIKKTYRKEALNRFDYDVVHLFTLKILIALIPQEKKKTMPTKRIQASFPPWKEQSNAHTPGNVKRVLHICPHICHPEKALQGQCNRFLTLKPG